MDITSLALQAELAQAAQRGRVTDRGGYLVVETPDDPGFYYGNLLVLPGPPHAGEVARWLRAFDHEFGTNPRIRHVTLWWDGIDGDAGAVDELAGAGFALERSLVMIADRATVAASAPIGSARALSPAEVLETVAVGIEIADDLYDAHEEFLHRRASWHRQLVEAGRARCYGVRDDEDDDHALVANLLLVELDALHKHGSVATIEDVQTIEAYRKRGYAAAMLAAAARDTSAERLMLLVLEGNADAQRVYNRAGFRAVESTVSACRYPPRDADER